MPYIEARGGSIRVKWWGGEYHLDANGGPTKRKKYESASRRDDGTPFQDEDEAYDYGLDRESDLRNGRGIKRSDSSILMGELCPAWLDLQELAHDSIRAYRTVINAQILPYWRARAVGDITVPQYDAWAKQVRARWSPAYAKNILMVFGLIMEYAVSCDMRKASPVVKVRRRGKYVPRKKERKTDLDIAVVHDLALNANELWGYAGYVFFLTIAFTGLRRAEVFGLRREFSSPTWPASDPRLDPDEEHRYKADMLRYGTGEGRMPALRVEHQHMYIRRVPTLAMPKYGSRRTLVLPPFLHEMHEALLKSHDSEWTFPSVLGGPLLHTEWSGRYYGPIARGTQARGGRFPLPSVPPVPEWLVPDGKGGVKPRRMHLLRHGHKEWLDEPGVVPRVAVEARMGHELPGVEGVYSHVTTAMEQRIMEVLQGRWEAFTATLGANWVGPSPIRLPRG
jgi:integrase